MTLNERRTLAVELLTEDPARSDRSLAPLCGLSRETIARIRARLIAAGRIAAAPVRGRDGKLYGFRTRKPEGAARVRMLRNQLQSLVARVRAPETAEGFKAAASGTRDGLGKLSLELAAEVHSLRRRMNI